MVKSRATIRVTPFRALVTLLITYLLSPLPLQVGFRVEGLGSLPLLSSGFRGLVSLGLLAVWGVEGFRVERIRTVQVLRFRTCGV